MTVGGGLARSASVRSPRRSAKRIRGARDCHPFGVNELAVVRAGDVPHKHEVGEARELTDDEECCECQPGEDAAASARRHG